MTKSFEVSIAIILLLSFVFFVFEIRTLDYDQIEIPDYIRNIILNNVKDTQFRELLNNKDSITYINCYIMILIKNTL